MGMSFAALIKQAEATARENDGKLATGADALKADDKPRRSDISQSMFNVGDEFTVPAYPGTPGSTPETDARYVSAPISKGGVPVLRVYVDVKNGDFTETKPLFMGTFTKRIMNVDTQQIVAAKGTAVELLRNCITNNDCWKVLAGKRLKVVDCVNVPYIRRGWNGQPDRRTTTNVLTIDVIG